MQDFVLYISSCTFRPDSRRAPEPSNLDSTARLNLEYIQPAVTASSNWSNESDADFETFQSSVQELRASDVWRPNNSKDAP